MRDCTKNIISVMRLCRDLLSCADRGDLQRNDASCGVLFGLVRDNAYKMFDLACRERKSHIAKGSWDFDDDDNEPGIEKKQSTGAAGA
jgi:hypothetical protein